MDEDSSHRRGDPLSFSDLDPDDIVGVYGASGRRGGGNKMRRAKGMAAGEGRAPTWSK